MSTDGVIEFLGVEGNCPSVLSLHGIDFSNAGVDDSTGEGNQQNDNRSDTKASSQGPKKRVKGLNTKEQRKGNVDDKERDQDNDMHMEARHLAQSEPSHDRTMEGPTTSPTGGSDEYPVEYPLFPDNKQSQVVADVHLPVALPDYYRADYDELMHSSYLNSEEEVCAEEIYLSGPHLQQSNVFDRGVYDY
ncbi:hypothetical protein VKT23_001377 [Stygiomarasmius scandens]|uniref:Uncharacterized protein n=1 Tax=Marasmiellus scandens TaxID=2682957 RepID=A0ABR1K6X0_9AGAR